MAQFTCGFIDVNETFSERINSEDGLREAILENGLRELKEELYDFSGAHILDTQFIGGIFERKPWPSKKAGNHTKEIKNFVITVKVNMTFDELQQARAEKIEHDKCQSDRESKYIPDAHEMTVINAIPKDQIKEDMTIELEGKERPFVAEHPKVLSVLFAQQAQEQKKNRKPYKRGASPLKYLAFLQNRIMVSGTQNRGKV